MAAPRKKKQGKWALTTKSLLTPTDVRRLIQCFSVGDWKQIKIKGDPSPNATTSPCIIVNNRFAKCGNLFAYEAMYLLQNGPVRNVQGYADRTISHLCCTEQRDGEKKHKNKKQNPNPCFNVEHMKLESLRVNKERDPVQQALKSRKHQWQMQNAGYQGPLFMKDGELTKIRPKRYASFTNCGVIEEYNEGFYVHKETATLRAHLRDLERAGITITRVNE